MLTNYVVLLYDSKQRLYQYHEKISQYKHYVCKS